MLRSRPRVPRRSIGLSVPAPIQVVVRTGVFDLKSIGCNLSKYNPVTRIGVYDKKALRPAQWTEIQAARLRRLLKFLKRADDCLLTMRRQTLQLRYKSGLWRQLHSQAPTAWFRKFVKLSGLLKVGSPLTCPIVVALTARRKVAKLIVSSISLFQTRAPRSKTPLT